jgi:hypothetical protein
MTYVIFGLILIFGGWNWLGLRSWWADQMWKSPLALPGSKDILRTIIGIAGLATILLGLFSIVVGIVALVTGVDIGARLGTAINRTIGGILF